MDDLDPDLDEQAPPRGRRRWLGRVLRVGLPVAFILFTAVSVWGIVDEGTPDRIQAGGTTTTSGPTPAAPGRVTIAATGDIGMDSAGEATLRAMAQRAPDLYLALGDLSYGGAGSEPEWCALVREIVGPVAPFELVAGNHEDDTGEDGFIGTFESCLPDRMNAVGEYGRQYYFDVGDLARVIAISPDLTIDGAHYYYGDGNENQRWLESAIDDARTKGIAWVIVATHKNCISVGEYDCLMHQDLFSLLIEKKVDLVISGHDHTYQRSTQLGAPVDGCDEVTVDAFDADCVVDDGDDDEYTKGAGPVFVVAGAGGAALYDIHADDPEAGYFASTMGANRDPRNGFVELVITHGELSATFVGSSPGDYADEFTVSAAR